MFDNDSELEQLRRSLAMSPPDGPATALTNHEAERLVADLIKRRKAQGAIPSSETEGVQRGSVQDGV